MIVNAHTENHGADDLYEIKKLGQIRKKMVELGSRSENKSGAEPQDETKRKTERGRDGSDRMQSHTHKHMERGEYADATVDDNLI